VQFLVENTSGDTGYGRVLRELSDTINKAEDGYLFHDHLEEENYAVYFHQFVQQAQNAGLQYMAETKLSSMLNRALPNKVHKALANGSMVERIQYLDFFGNTTFRKSLLCRAERSLQRDGSRFPLESFMITLDGHTGFHANANKPRTTTFQNQNGEFSVEQPLHKVALEYLVELWPQSLPFMEIYRRAMERLPENMKDKHQEMGEKNLGEFLHKLIEYGCLEASLHPPRFELQETDTPRTSALNRIRARNNHPLTNSRHENVDVDVFQRQILARLDGTHSTADLVAFVDRSLSDGK